MISGNRHFGFKTVSSEKIIDEVYKTTFENISIETDASDIEIIESTDDKVRLVIYGDEERTEVKVGNKRLEIITKAKRCFGLCFTRRMSKVELYLPSSFDKKLEISNKYGDIDVDEFLNLDLITREDCGNVEIKAVKKIDIVNKYGDISIDQVEKAKIKNECGNIKLGSLNNGEIRNNLGDITIEKVSGFIDIVEDCGNVKITRLDLEKDSKISNSLGDIKIGSTNELYIDAKTSLGDVKIENNYRHSEVTLKIDNSAGDIKIG